MSQDWWANHRRNAFRRAQADRNRQAAAARLSTHLYGVRARANRRTSYRNKPECATCYAKLTDYDLRYYYTQCYYCRRRAMLNRNY